MTSWPNVQSVAAREKWLSSLTRVNKAACGWPFLFWLLLLFFEVARIRGTCRRTEVSIQLIIEHLRQAAGRLDWDSSILVEAVGCLLYRVHDLLRMLEAERRRTRKVERRRSVLLTFKECLLLFQIAFANSLHCLRRSALIASLSRQSCLSPSSPFRSVKISVISAISGEILLKLRKILFPIFRYWLIRRLTLCFCAAKLHATNLS